MYGIPAASSSLGEHLVNRLLPSLAPARCLHHDVPPCPISAVKQLLVEGLVGDPLQSVAIRHPRRKTV
jgi:hypothetical protein